MKELVKQYGDFVLAGIIFIALVVLIFSGVQDGEGNQGMRSVLAAHMDVEGIDYSAYSDFEAYSAEGAKTFPTIAYRDNGYLPVGTVNFVNLVETVDYAGRVLGYAGSTVDEAERQNGYLKIASLEDAEGNNLSAGINMDTGEITFPAAGTYKVTLYAQDDGFRKTSSVIHVAVM